MRLTAPVALRWAVVFAASASVVSHADKSAIPNDLKVVTRIVTRLGDRHLTQTSVRYVKGTRLRSDQITEIDDASPKGSWVQIVQCDQRRVLSLNPQRRTYVSSAVQDERAVMRAGARRPLDVQFGPVVRITVDDDDTGERRRIGSYEARRIVTTESVDPSEGANTRRSQKVTDGWYIDLPRDDCRSASESQLTSRLAIAQVRRPGERAVFDKLEYRHLRTAPKGYLLEGTERTTTDQGTYEQKTELVEASTSPLPSELFEIPADYRPALPLPGGGYDLDRPDTLAARVWSYWNVMETWVRQLTSRFR